MKGALVKPLLKKATLDLIKKNYHPVSNLNFCSKAVKCVVAHQLVTHVESNNLMEPNQSAYRTNHSTETTILKVKSDIPVPWIKGRWCVWCCWIFLQPLIQLTTLSSYRDFMTDLGYVTQLWNGFAHTLWTTVRKWWWITMRVTWLPWPLAFHRVVFLVQTCLPCTLVLYVTSAGIPDGVSTVCRWSTGLSTL